MAGKKNDREKEEKKGGGIGGALSSTVTAIAGVAFVWAAVELAFKPWLQSGRDALNKSLDPSYDVDDELDRSEVPRPKAKAAADDEKSEAGKKVVGKDPSV